MATIFLLLLLCGLLESVHVHRPSAHWLESKNYRIIRPDVISNGHTRRNGGAYQVNKIFEEPKTVHHLLVGHAHPVKFKAVHLKHVAQSNLFADHKTSEEMLGRETLRQVSTISSSSESQELAETMQDPNFSIVATNSDSRYASDAADQYNLNGNIDRVYFIKGSYVDKSEMTVNQDKNQRNRQRFLVDRWPHIERRGFKFYQPKNKLIDSVQNSSDQQIVPTNLSNVESNPIELFQADVTSIPIIIPEPLMPRSDSGPPSQHTYKLTSEELDRIIYIRYREQLISGNSSVNDKTFGEMSHTDTDISNMTFTPTVDLKTDLNNSSNKEDSTYMGRSINGIFFDIAINQSESPVTQPSNQISTTSSVSETIVTDVSVVQAPGEKNATLHLEPSRLEPQSHLEVTTAQTVIEINVVDRRLDLNPSTESSWIRLEERKSTSNPFTNSSDEEIYSVKLLHNFTTDEKLLNGNNVNGSLLNTNLTVVLVADAVSDAINSSSAESGTKKPNPTLASTTELVNDTSLAENQTAVVLTEVAFTDNITSSSSQTIAVNASSSLDSTTEHSLLRSTLTSVISEGRSFTVNNSRLLENEFIDSNVSDSNSINGSLTDNNSTPALVEDISTNAVKNISLEDVTKNENSLSNNATDTSLLNNNLTEVLHEGGRIDVNLDSTLQASNSSILNTEDSSDLDPNNVTEIISSLEQYSNNGSSQISTENITDLVDADGDESISSNETITTEEEMLAANISDPFTPHTENNGDIVYGSESNPTNRNPDNSTDIENSNDTETADEVASMGKSNSVNVDTRTFRWIILQNGRTIRIRVSQNWLNSLVGKQQKWRTMRRYIYRKTKKTRRIWKKKRVGGLSGSNNRVAKKKMMRRQRVVTSRRGNGQGFVADMKGNVAKRGDGQTSERQVITGTIKKKRGHKI